MNLVTHGHILQSSLWTQGHSHFLQSSLDSMTWPHPPVSLISAGRFVGFRTGLRKEIALPGWMQAATSFVFLFFVSTTSSAFHLYERHGSWNWKHWRIVLSSGRTWTFWDTMSSISHLTTLTWGILIIILKNEGLGRWLRGQSASCASKKSWVWIPRTCKKCRVWSMMAHTCNPHTSKAETAEPWSSLHPV